ncbi:MAG TPA: hypothetical protein DCZ04_10920 [Syntrophorhabdus aromaticivorans]|nr:hypothetical protein [Syntrophorhabdus aromaticivorans]
MAPELNPVEKPWRCLRKEITHNTLFRKLEDMTHALEQDIRRLVSEKLIQLASLLVFMALQGGERH